MLIEEYKVHIYETAEFRVPPMWGTHTGKGRTGGGKFPRCQFGAGIYKYGTRKPEESHRNPTGLLSMARYLDLFHATLLE